MRAMLILLSAVILGLAGGYSWSAMNVRPARAAAARRATTMPLPASPEERPSALDARWASEANGEARSADGPAIGPAEGAAQDQSVHYAGCNAVRAAGKAPLYAGQPGYRPEMDGDDDGIACEPHSGR